MIQIVGCITEHCDRHNQCYRKNHITFLFFLLFRLFLCTVLVFFHNHTPRKMAYSYAGNTSPPVCTCMFYIIPYSSALYVIKSFLLFFIILSLLRKNGYEIFNRYDKMNSLSLLYTVTYYQSNRRYIINGKKKSYRRTVRWTDCRHQ